VRLSVLSSCIGPSCVAIVVNEATSISVEMFIRVGSIGGGPAHPAWRSCHFYDCRSLGGASHRYVIAEYPAVANYDVLLALIKAAESLRVSCHVG